MEEKHQLIADQPFFAQQGVQAAAHLLMTGCCHIPDMKSSARDVRSSV